MLHTTPRDGLRCLHSLEQALGPRAAPAWQSITTPGITPVHPISPHLSSLSMWQRQKMMGALVSPCHPRQRSWSSGCSSCLPAVGGEKAAPRASGTIAARREAHFSSCNLPEPPGLHKPQYQWALPFGSSDLRVGEGPQAVSEETGTMWWRAKTGLPWMSCHLITQPGAAAWQTISSKINVKEHGYNWTFGKQRKPSHFPSNSSVIHSQYSQSLLIRVAREHYTEISILLSWRDIALKPNRSCNV